MNTNNFAKQMNQLATQRYHTAYDNHLYTKATQDKSTVYANALIDEALALCGSPHYKLSHRRWGKDALVFLSWFAQ